MAKNYTAAQVADVIMNDDTGEMDSVDSLDESSSSSSNDEPSSQSEVDSNSNTDFEFHGRQVLIEKRSVRNRPSKRAKTRGGISNQGRTIRTRGGIQTIVELSEQEEAFQTVGKEP